MPPPDVAHLLACSQGWKAFALAHTIQPGDRIEFELLLDGRRMRAAIVKRAVYKELVAVRHQQGLTLAASGRLPSQAADSGDYGYSSMSEMTTSEDAAASSSPRTAGAAEGGVDSDVAAAVAILATAQRPRQAPAPASDVGASAGSGAASHGPLQRLDSGAPSERRSPYLRTPTLQHESREGRGAAPASTSRAARPARRGFPARSRRTSWRCCSSRAGRSSR